MTSAAGSRLRVLYLMHVDWRWIRQRPHHLADGLATHHDVEVLYPHSWRRSALPPEPAGVRRRAILQVPLRRHSAAAAAVNLVIQRRAVHRAIASLEPDVVWLTHPRLEPLLPERLPSRTAIVYDCMDDAAAFPDTPLERRGVAEAEARLARRAACTFASSGRLAELLASRGFPRERVEVVRNAAPDDLVPPLAAPRERVRGTLRASYFGTISSWLDFDALVASLDALPELAIDLVGPCETAVPAHPGLRVQAPVIHERLASLASDADVLLVPFRRTPLVEAVDPVKLYEYVAFGREVVSLRWGEVERFAPFAHLYDTSEQLTSILRAIARGELRCAATREQRLEFLQQNRWSARVRQIEGALERVREGQGWAA